MKKKIETSLRKSYVEPHCEVLVVAAECQVTTGSGNLPTTSPGTDMGGGEGEEPITIGGGAKSGNVWGEPAPSVWDN